uniref:Uncharacterized protein n=1 Tax=Klebsiella pneumoniae TaxID=573 RepID=A0A8B0SVG7_KLEPN|nr:hypothetical protein [Klebsiella pneumoniae]
MRPGSSTVPAADFDMLETFKSSITIIAWFFADCCRDFVKVIAADVGDMRM